MKRHTMTTVRRAGQNSGRALPSAEPPRRRIAPWYFAYLILGLLTSGMLPFLLPLVVAGLSHQLSTVAYVTGAYYLGLLPAPIFGVLAERRQLYRPIFFSAFLLLALGFVTFPLVTGLMPWFLLALLIGAAAGAAATVATLFIVDFEPRTEWEPRIGWLQTFNGAGQLAGLLLAASFAHGAFVVGFTLAGGLALVAVMVGGIGLPPDGCRRVGGNPLRRLPVLRFLAAVQLNSAVGGLLQHSHHLQCAALRGLRSGLRGAFSRFLLSWSAYNFGVAAFFAYYPLVMRQSYGIPPAITALTYAVAAGISIFLFIAASQLAVRYGARLVFLTGLMMRMLGFLLLGAPFAVAVPRAAQIALLGFLLAMLAWPVLSVSGTALAARLTPISEGAAIGLLGTSTALATVVGTFTSGPLVHRFGYGVVAPLAIVGLAAAVLLMLPDEDRCTKRTRA